jgi:myosin-1
MKLKKDPQQYTYLAHSECSTVDTIDDVRDFKDVTVRHVMKLPHSLLQKALGILGFTDDDKKYMWKILAAILHVGNIQFADDPAKPNKVLIQNQSGTIFSDIRWHLLALDTAAAVFEVPALTLAKVLTSRSISTGSTGKRQSQINIPLDVVGVRKFEFIYLTSQSQFTRDALAKAVYYKLFDWLIEKLNARLACKTPGKKSVIGFLDIYGKILDLSLFSQSFQFFTFSNFFRIWNLWSKWILDLIDRSNEL